MAGALAIFASMALAACDKTIDTDDLESQLVEQLSKNAGVSSDGVSVECPNDITAEEGKKFDCTLTASDDSEVTVNVTLTDDDGGFNAVVPKDQFK